MQRVVKHDSASVALIDRTTGPSQASGADLHRRPGVVEPDIRSDARRLGRRRHVSNGVARVFRKDDLDRFFKDGPPLLPPSLQSLCCVPLATRRGTLGTLNVASVDPDAFPPHELDLLKQISTQVAIAMENALAYQEIMGLKDHLAEEKEYLEAEIRLDRDFGGVIGESSSLRDVLRAVETVAPTDATVLIRGETGTGKEMLARAIHNLSPRRDRTFVRLNLAALPASLIESELFGTSEAPSRAPPAARSAAWNWPTAARCSSTRRVISRRKSSRSCCAPCRKRNSSAWAARARSGLTFG